MEPRDIENPIAESDFRNQMRNDYYDRYKDPKGCKWTFLTLLILVLLTIIFLLTSCNKETFCWSCHIKDRIVDSHGTVTNWYLYSFEICNETEEEIFYFEKRNTVIIDTARMLGTFIECKKQ